MKPLIIIDEGHGKDTPGKRCEKFNFYEWEYTRRMGKILKELLLNNGFQVFKLEEDLDTPLAKRTQIYNSKPSPKLVLSMHGNAFNGESANGYEHFTSKGQTESDKIAQCIWNHISKSCGLNLRPDMSDGDHDKEENFWILNKTNCPAILFELGFYTNPNDVAKMKDDTWVRIQMQSIVNGLLDYYGR